MVARLIQAKEAILKAMASKNNNKKLELSPTPKAAKKPKKIEAKTPVESSNRDHGLTIVGIGASAGGLEALQSFFKALPADTGMAFVVVTHLHPEYESHMAELLQKSTPMPTMQVTERTRVEANHVYVIPPNRTIQMTDTHLDVQEFDEPHGRRTPIDHFFRSMAASGHSDPVAIILSGGGTDGSVGVKAVKEVGGLIMVQQPEDAEYDSMPRAALTTGLVDVVLPAVRLAQKLTDYVQHHPQLPHDPGQLSDTEIETLQQILAQVHARTRHDFTQYKRSTILRRVERRMQLNGLVTLGAYLNYLRNNGDEAQAMFNDILIGVTNFFRDRDSWTALQEKVIPRLFQDKGEDKAIRVWSIGCATGEEAYGLAMLLFEEAARQKVHTPIQIFATDLDERSIAHAREGRYPAAIETDVSSERLERFFTKDGEYYRVKRELRDVVLFTNHNVMRDPPFSHQDLIACRNVLIYLQRTVQERVFDIFHYALKPGGFLYLGTSESADHLPDLFHPIDKHHHIYRAKPWAGDRPRVPFMSFTVHRDGRTPDAYPAGQGRPGRYTSEPAVLAEQHQKALETYGPPSVLVNERYQILHVSETAGRYLHQPVGPVTGEILSMVRPELQAEMRTALFQAFEKANASVSRPIAVQFDGHKRRVVVSVRPQTGSLGWGAETHRQALVVFLEDEIENVDAESGSSGTPYSQVERDAMVADLQSKVQRLGEQLQITTEEHESSNEELQSINEEYRSATEELETSKEELQSLNEELQTVNADMRNKLDEISRAHQELENLMGATEIPTLFLDREMRIQRFSAGVQEHFSIMKGDRGRYISDLTHKLGYEQFVEDAQQALRGLLPVEREMQTPEGKWFLIRLRPYRTVDDKVEGVVITFIDIDKLKKAEHELVLVMEQLEDHVSERTRELAQANEQIRRARDMFFTLFHSNPIPTSLTKAEDGTVLNVNDAYLEFASLRREDVIGHNAPELGLPIDRSIRPQIINRLQSEGIIENLELQVRRASGEMSTVQASIQLIEVDDTQALLLAFIDITDRVKAEQQIRSLAYELTKAEQEERRRISQILHDDLQQRIFAIKMQISSLDEAHLSGDVQSAQVDFAQLQEWLDESISITRNLSIDLSPAILKGEGLTDALVWLAAQMKEQYGLQITLQPNGIAARYEDALRILLFQAVREILFNIVKHADTREATISMERVDGHIRVAINDDGIGFDAQAILEGSKTAGGLLNLQHRLNLMGCNLQINSSPNSKGTQVIIDIPSDK